jgi:hypothetical protein
MCTKIHFLQRDIFTSLCETIFSTLVIFQDCANGDAEIDIKPDWTICRDGVNVSQEMEECGTGEIK